MPKNSFKNRAIPELFKDCVNRYGEHRAVIDNRCASDFNTFNHFSDRLAFFFAANGIRKGDRVALYGINSDIFAMAYMGIVKAGATVVPINVFLSPVEIAYILSDAGVKALFYIEAFAENVKIIRQNMKEPAFCICSGSKKADAKDSTWADVLNTDGLPPEIHFAPSEDLVSILYTSGTTGYPKGAMLTHRNLAANTWSIKKAMHFISGKEVILVVLPMFHAFAATVGMLFPLLYGCTFVPLPKFDPEQIVQSIEEEKVTVFLGVPSMYNVLLKLPDTVRTKLSSLKFAISGGAPMPVEIMKRFEEKFGILIYEGDGPTECSPVTCVNPIGGLRKPGSVGKSLPLVEMKIFNEQGKELEHGAIGEICVRGPNVMKGYWNQPEETAKAFFGDWFRTGDLGREDDDGYFFIVDRKKDLIIVNGMNIYPRVIEEVLYKFSPVAEAAVIGEPHHLHGEIPVAYVTLHKDQDATTDDVRTFCRSYLGRYEVPRKIFIVKELPKNAAGKILKHEIRKINNGRRGTESLENESK